MKKKIKKENDKLKKELKDWNSSFTNIYDKLVLKKKSIYEEEEEKKYNIQIKSLMKIIIIIFK